MTTPQQLAPYRIVARNRAQRTDNAVTHDERARELGFRSGLVPGTTLFAYLVSPVVLALGREWLERGTIGVRFKRPVYDGEEVTVEVRTATPDSARNGAVRLEVEASTEATERFAVATANLPAASQPPPDLSDYPRAALPGRRLPASEILNAPSVLGTVEKRFDSQAAAGYLEGVGEELPIYRQERIAHPAWLLRFANAVLGFNMALGPRLHTSSQVEFFQAVQDGDELSTRARVADLFERKGLRYVVLDVLMAANESHPVMHVRHEVAYGLESVARPG